MLEGSDARQFTIQEKAKLEENIKIANEWAVKEKLDVFLSVHNSSLGVSQSIIDIIGEHDAATFINIVDKLATARYKAYPQKD